jgi:hypothetical protein
MEHNIFLMSNGSTSLYPENTLTSFRNKIPTDYLSDSVQWKVAMESVGIYNKFRNSALPKPYEIPTIIAFTSAWYEAHFKYGSELNIKSLHNYQKIYFYHGTEIDADIIDVHIDTHQHNNVGINQNNYIGKILTISPNDKNKVIIGQFSWPPHLIHPICILIHQNFATYLELPEPTNSDGVDSKIIIDGEVYVWYSIQDKTVTYESGIIKPYHPNGPAMVKIQCKNIMPYMSSAGFCQDLGHITLPHLKSHTFHHHQFKNIEWFNLQTKNLESIDIKLVDGEGETLIFEDGYSTLVKLHFKKGMEERIYVRIDSKKSKLYPDNNAAIFKIKLPDRLSLLGKWKVGLSSIIYEQDFDRYFNQTFYIGMKYVGGDGVMVERAVNIADCNNMRQVFKIVKKELEECALVTLKFGHVHMKFVIRARVIMSKDLVKFFGMKYSNDRITITNAKEAIIDKDVGGEILFPHKMTDLENALPNMFLYSNIVDSTCVGGQMVKLMKVVPIAKNPHGSNTMMEFETEELFPVSNSSISEIEFELRLHSGEVVPFKNNANTTFLTIVFQKDAK